MLSAAADFLPRSPTFFSVHFQKFSRFSTAKGEGRLLLAARKEKTLPPRVMTGLSEAASPAGAGRPGASVTHCDALWTTPCMTHDAP